MVARSRLELESQCAVALFVRLSDPEALEREGMEACEAIGVPGHNAAWKPRDWDDWYENFREAARDLVEIASHSGEQPPPSPPGPAGQGGGTIEGGG